MNWDVVFLEEAEKDLKRLDHSVQVQVVRGINKVAQNPLSIYEGGYGKPLGNKGGNDLSNLMKIKFRKLGVRVVYMIERKDSIMRIIIIAARADEQVYRDAAKRRKNHNL